MGLLERAQENGFLDLDGFDGPERAFFAGIELEEKWRAYCQEHDLPVLVVDAGFAGNGLCYVKASWRDRECLAAIASQSNVSAATDTSLTDLESGSWISDQMSREEAISWRLSS